MTMDSGELQILGAAYGRAVVTSTVLAAVNRAVNPQSLTIKADNATFGDSWPNVRKSLTVVYRYGSGPAQIKSAQEGTVLAVSAASDSPAAETSLADGASPALTVWGASYGPADVSQKVRSMIDANQQLALTADNQTFGDSWPNVRKSFVIVASYQDQVPFTDVIEEGSPYSLKYRPRLQIMSGFYGLLDVTAQLQASVSRRTLSIVASNGTFGDGWPGVAKSLALVYQYGAQTPQLKIVTEGQALSVDYDPSVPPYAPLPDPSALNVLAASYGRGDVTQKVRSLIDPSTQQLSFNAGNNLFGDTWPGVRKSFTILYGRGTAPTLSAVMQEGAAIQIGDEPRIASTFLPLTGFLANGDHLQVTTGTGLSWAVDGTGQVVATNAPAAGTSLFTIAGVAAGSGSFQLQASDGSYLMVTNGALRSGGSAAQAAVLIPSAVNGSVALAVAGGAGAPFLVVSPTGGAVTLGAGYAPEFSSTFVLMLEPTEEGFRNHLSLHTGRTHAQLKEDALGDPKTLALLKVIWDLTGGWFLALGLGPLLRGADEAAPGVMAILRQNQRISAMIDRIIKVALENWGKLGLAALLAIPAAIWDEGLMGQVVRAMFNFGFWIGVAWVICKIALWVSVPTAKAAEMVYAFANWAYTTITDVVAYVNTGGGPVALPERPAAGGEADQPAAAPA